MDIKVVLDNVFWKFSERFGAQGFNFLVSVILARLLSPTDFGKISLVTVFISIFQVFIDSGLGNALIQKSKTDDDDYSTVFYFNLVVCLIIYIFIFLAAPIIADFYNDTSLVSVIRTLGITVLISGVKNIQQAYVAKHMLFKNFFLATSIGTFISGFAGIIMAYSGFGLWALVFQYLLNNLIDTLILWLTIKWRPRLFFNFEKLKILFSYGWKLLVSSLLDTLYNNLRSLVIAKKFNTSDLAYYNKGEQFPSFLVVNLNSAIDSVMFPTMSFEQSDLIRVKNIIKRSMQIGVFFIWPLLFILSFSSESIVIFLLGNEWLQSIPYLKLFCIYYAFWPLYTINLNAIKAVGRSDIFLKLEFIKKILGILMLLLTVALGPLSIAKGMIILSPIYFVINALPCSKIFNYGYLEQIKDLLPNGINCVLMYISLFVLKYFFGSSMTGTIATTIVGLLFYILFAYLLNNDSLLYIKNILKNEVKK